MLDITSPHNPRLKAAAKLRDRKHRVREGRFLIDGRREFERAIKGGIVVQELFVNDDQSDDELLALVEFGRQSGANVLTTSSPVFEKLTFGDRDEGIVAVGITPTNTLDGLQLPTNPLIVVLEGIEKPGNVGAILRTAEAAGVSAVIVADGGTDLYNPNAIRASLGAIFTVPVCAATSADALAWLKQRNITIFAARVDGAIDYAAVSYRAPTAIVLGSEAHGLSAAWQRPEITAISLPMQGVVDSLNVSATAAVLFYEAMRQRRP
jgi:TrmH family RNA methyltransferase